MSIQRAAGSTEPIQMVEECWENQRWWTPTQRYSSNLFPTDRPPFSNKDGTEDRDRERIALPSNAWRWTGDWQIENKFEGQALEDGWIYAFDFPRTYSPLKTMKSYVRRRKWIRIREYVPSGRWNLAAFNSSNQSNEIVSGSWAIGGNGNLYFRAPLILGAPKWTEIKLPNGVENVPNQIVLSADGTPFIITKTNGDLLYRKGVSSQNSQGTEWATVNGPRGGISQISCGTQTLWAITKDKKCWLLKGSLEDTLLAVEPPAKFEWTEIPGKFKAICVSRNDRVVLGIRREDGEILHRVGVTHKKLGGDDWAEVKFGEAKYGRSRSLIDQVESMALMSLIPMAFSGLSISTVEDDLPGANSSRRSSEPQIFPHGIKSTGVALPGTVIPGSNQVDGAHSRRQTEPNILLPPEIKFNFLTASGRAKAKIRSGLQSIFPFTSASSVAIDSLNDAKSPANFKDVAQPELETIGGHCPLVRTESDLTAELQVYHPLSMGFLPGSDLVIDLLIPSNARSFAFILNGKDSPEIFNFSFQLGDGNVLRNSRDASGSWVIDGGNDGSFPFTVGQAYTLHISCDPTHLVVKVAPKNTFKYFYKHQLPPSNISHLFIVGDVDVAGVFYKPSSDGAGVGGDRLKKHVEFRLNPALSLFGGSNEFAIAFTQDIDNCDSDDLDLDNDLGYRSASPEFVEVKDLESVEDDPTINTPTYRQVLYLIVTFEVKDRIQSSQRPDICTAIENNEKLKALEGQCGQSPAAITLDKWLVYCRVQRENPRTSKLFHALPQLFSAVLEAYNNGDLNENDIRSFWQAFDKLVDNFADFIQNMRQVSLEADCIDPLCRMLSQIAHYLPPVSYQYLLHKLNHAVFIGATNFITTLLKTEISNSKYIVAVTKIGQILIDDLNKCDKRFDGPFQRLCGINCFEKTYFVYDAKYFKVVQPLVKKMAENSKLINKEQQQQQRLDDQGFEKEFVGIRNLQFQLYLTVKEFSSLALKPSSKASSIKLQDLNLKIAPVFHQWFQPFINQWLDAALYEVKHLITKALHHPHTEMEKNNSNLNLKFSSSALDTLTIFDQIYLEGFWKNLSFPELETEFTTASRILDDFNKCTIFYIGLLNQKLEEKQCKKIKFDRLNADLSNKISFAVKDLDYLAEVTKVISSKLKFQNIFNKIKLQKSLEILEHYQHTLKTVQDSARDSITVQMQNILTKLEHAIVSMLQEALPTKANVRLDIGPLIKYLDEIIITFKRNLTPARFTTAHAILWQVTLKVLKNLIQTGVERRSSSVFFRRIQTILNDLYNFFFPPDLLQENAHVIMSPENGSLLKEIQDILDFQGATTAELIVKYARERHANQMQAEIEQKEKAPSMISILAAYIEEAGILRVEILNCRRLKTQKPRIDPYVKLRLVLNTAAQIPSKTTKVIKKTDCPLFDETFDIPLCSSTDEMLPTMDSFISLTVFNDGKIIGRDELLGEAFLPLESVPRLKMEESKTKFQKLPQEQLPLTLPCQTSKTTAILDTLEKRISDPRALQFVKEEKLKQP